VFDRILMVLEIILLIVIVWQGEIIVRCERGVYRLQKEREAERSKWREQKRQQQIRKDAAGAVAGKGSINSQLIPPAPPTAMNGSAFDVAISEFAHGKKRTPENSIDIL